MPNPPHQRCVPAFPNQCLNSDLTLGWDRRGWKNINYLIESHFCLKSSAPHYYISGTHTSVNKLWYSDFQCITDPHRMQTDYVKYMIRNIYFFLRNSFVIPTNIKHSSLLKIKNQQI